MRQRWFLVPSQKPKMDPISNLFAKHNIASSFRCVSSLIGYLSCVGTTWSTMTYSLYCDLPYGNRALWWGQPPPRHSSIPTKYNVLLPISLCRYFSAQKVSKKWGFVKKDHEQLDSQTVVVSDDWQQQKMIISKIDLEQQ